MFLGLSLSVLIALIRFQVFDTNVYGRLQTQ